MGDSDSAIHLDCSYDSLRLSPPEVLRPLQRSVSDVVVRDWRTRPGSPFSTPLYRGFLLRHQRRQKNYSPDILSHQGRQADPSPGSPTLGPGKPVSVAILQTGSQRSGQTPRMVKARCRRQKTTILITPDLQ